MPDPLPPGLYDALVSAEVADAAAAVPSAIATVRRTLEPSDAHERLARYFAGELERVLHALRSHDGGTRGQAELVNELLDVLRARASPEGLEDSSLVIPPELLLAVHPPPAPPPRPTVPLAASTLLTHARGEPRLGAEIAAEIPSADSVDMLVSFIKWHGWRRLKDSFEAFARREAAPRPDHNIHGS